VSFAFPGCRADVERAPHLLDALLLTLLEHSYALKDGNVARLAAAESRRRHLLRLLGSPVASSGRLKP